MKKTLQITISLLLIFIMTISLSSCSAFIDYLNELATMTDTVYTQKETTNEQETTIIENNTIPFKYTPDIEEYVLQKDNTDDQIEKEAGEIIDESIAKAISYVNAMKDSRHSNISYDFDKNANGYLDKLSSEDLKYYNKFITAAKNGQKYTLNENEYSGELKKLFFALYEPMTYCEPGISSYFTLDCETHVSASDMVSHYSKIFDRYFDPNYDGNVGLSNGATLEKIMHDASLLDHVVKRVIKYMPSGLTTYDKYYYLACVLSEQVSYDARPDNCFTAYGALIGKRAVCEGYTAAYYMLCREANLYCAYRNGQPRGSGHTWNMIKLDSGIYNVDVTWCDGYGKPYEEDWYDCFIKSDTDFENDGHNATTGVSGTGNYEKNPYEE